jgi:ketosteroid isomerase-like protein
MHLHGESVMTKESENLATVKGIYEAFGRGDIPYILGCLAEDVAWESWDDNSAQRGGVSYMQPRSGPDGAAAFFGIVAKMNVTEFQVLNLMAGGDSVAAEFVIAAHNPDTGKAYRDGEMHLWTFNEQGEIVRLRHYVDTAKHVAAANAG